jgi:flagellar biosynthesis/type III secretory pathway chaperone
LSADSQQLQQLLHTELTTLQSLAAALDAEHAALLSADVVALETATAAKNTAIQAHRDQQSLRINWMQKRTAGRRYPAARTCAQHRR